MDCVAVTMGDFYLLLPWYSTTFFAQALDFPVELTSQMVTCVFAAREACFCGKSASLPGYLLW